MKAKDSSNRIKVRGRDKSPKNFKRKRSTLTGASTLTGEKLDVIVGWKGEDMLFNFEGFIYK